MFDYEELSRKQIVELCSQLPRKVVRWLGAHHPDMRTRRIFFEVTNVEIGEGTVINPNLIVSDGYMPLLKSGKRVAFSPNVTVICESAPNNSLLQKVEYVEKHLICAKPIIICDDVWIGANVVILPGVTIGEMSIIGAGAVVSKDVPPRAIAVGVPARVIRYLNVNDEDPKSCPPQ